MTDVKIFGDSILKGVYFDGRYHVTKDKINVNNCNIDNYSKIGATIEDGIKNINRHIDELNEDTIVILEYGGNDCNYNWEEVSLAPKAEHECAVEPDNYKEKFFRAVNLVKEKGSKIIIASPIPMCANKFMDFISQNLSYENILEWLGSIDALTNWKEYYAQLTEKIAKMTNCAIMPLKEAFNCKNIDNLFCADGIHPTEEGHEYLHRYIENYLATVI